MAMIQDLKAIHIHECLIEAVGRQIPVALSCRLGMNWYNLRTRFICADPPKLWLEPPVSSDAGPTPDLAVGTEIGLSFKFGHHKHIFNTAIAAISELSAENGQWLRALCVPWPIKMERMQRRAYERVNVPRDRSVLVTFWQAGIEDMANLAADAPLGGPKGLRRVLPGLPAGSKLTWEGWATNLSAGGFQVRLIRNAAPRLEQGEVLGARIDLGQEFPPVLANAQFRQQLLDDRGIILQGFQFVGLNDSAIGREMLARVGQIVCEFQRLESRRKAV